MQTHRALAMGATGAESSSSAAAALLGAFAKISSTAVPGLVDALLLTTQCPPSSLLLGLLQLFPNVRHSDVGETTTTSVQGEMDIIQTYMAAISHLLENKESGEEDLLRALWTIFIPILRSSGPDLSILQIQVAEMLAKATSLRSYWDAVKKSLFSLCLNSLYPSLQAKGETTASKDLVVIAYGDWEGLEKRHSVVPKPTILKSQDELLLNSFAVTQLLAALLTAALEASSSVYRMEMVDGGPSPAQKFCEDIVAVFLAPALAALSQPLDDSLRRYSIQNLLRPLLTAALTFGWLDDVSPENRTATARSSPMQEVWLCCQALLLHGSSQKRDAYMALAVFADLLIPLELFSQQKMLVKNIYDIEQNRKFDIRDEIEFWEVLKVGLGDEDSLTRKRALHILRRALCTLQSTTLGSKTLMEPTNVLPPRDMSGKSNSKGPTTQFSTKRNKWADEEAASLGVAAVKEKMTPVEGWSQRWDAFILLYETLEEYGTHLVEAAWSHQMSLLLQFIRSKGETRDSGPYWSRLWPQRRLRYADVNFTWISVLWQRGFSHTNPQVRRLVMQSFLVFEWERILNLSSLLPDIYVLRSLLQALDDSNHHRDFGMKGVYSSTTAEGAAKFMRAYSAALLPRQRVSFVVRLGKALVAESRTRPGLMTLAICLEAAALGSSTGKANTLKLTAEKVLPVNGSETLQSSEGPEDLLDVLKSVIETSKCHFNPKYRAKVCGHVLGAASALVVLPNISFSGFAYFLSSFPRELLIHGGSLHNRLISWVQSAETALSLNVNKWVLEGLLNMVEVFLKPLGPSSFLTDQDVEALRMGAGRWARLLMIGLVKGNDILGIIMFIQKHASQIYNHAYSSTCRPEGILLLIQALFRECVPSTEISTGSAGLSALGKDKELFQSESEEKTRGVLEASISDMVLSVIDDIKDFARQSAAIFWEHDYSGPVPLPGSVTGNLGGPSQRRLPSTLTSAVLQAVIAISTVAHCSFWCCQVGRKVDIPESVLNFLWQYAWKAMQTRSVMDEVGAELQLAVYEALTSVCSALAATAHPFYISAAYASIRYEGKSFTVAPVRADLMVDGLINALLQSVNALAFVGALARSRRSVLAAYKWSCLDSLLSIPKSAVSDDNEFPGKDQLLSAASSSALEGLLQDSIDSLESAGEEYLLPLLRCIRWLMGWGVLAQMATDDYSGEKSQVMWTLVQSGWSAMGDCNKRKVAPIAAFISAMFHPAIFGDLAMHGSEEDDEEHGPLKWLLNRLLEQGSRSPRTMRLTALHITGLWLMFPGTTILYMQELKKLVLHGGESVDEELDGEIMESHMSAREYAALIQSFDPELTKEFTNSEMYVRVMVAVMVDKLATLVEDQKTCDSDVKLLARTQAANFGQKFLLQLLNAAAEDGDLSKELYKKKSAIHRRKVRLWQMMCILSRFLSEDNVDTMSSLLKVCLYKNNMPSVRQYIEIFAVQFYSRFPHLVEESLIPALHDHNMKTQALSSYVLIATKVLMFTPAPRQSAVMHQVFPAIFPFMTSHHHNLRSFTQVLIYKILQQFSSSEALVSTRQGAFLEEQCLQSLAHYLDANADCTRMRTSIEKHVDAFDPFSTTRPRGIFCSQTGEVDPTRSAEDHPFECAPVALLDQVGYFLNEAREELRESMAADALVLTAERFSNHPDGLSNAYPHTKDHSNVHCQPKSRMLCPVTSRFQLDSAAAVVSCAVTKNPGLLPNAKLDIQTKITPLRFSDANTSYDVEEELLLSSIESRARDLIRMQGSRQHLVVVASLLGRVPNLAGLARTCEVFKASSLVVADSSIAEDRQFQLISVTADQWIPLVEVPEASLGSYLTSKRSEGYSILGLEQTANSISIDKYSFPTKVVLVLGRESDGIPVDIIQMLDTCLEIPQLGVIRSLNVHVSGAIAIWEYTRQHLMSQIHPDFLDYKSC